MARLVCKKWRAAVLRWKLRVVCNNAQFDALARCAHALRHLHTLNTYGCTGITDIRALAGIHALDMGKCTGITDVSALAGIHTLLMHGCTGITDVSALADIRELWMDGCTGITDVSALVGIRELHITRTQEHRVQGIDALRAAGCAMIVW